MGTFGGAQPIVTDGLVFAVDAANYQSYPGSGTTWSDMAGNNNGTLTYGPTFDSGNGGSIVFDGVNDYVDTNNDLQNISYLTLNVWLKFNTQTSSPWHGVITKNQYFDFAFAVGGSSAPGKGVIYLVNSTNQDSGNVTTTSRIDDNNWHNLVTTFDGNSVKIYVDSNLENSASLSGIIKSTFGKNIYIAGYQNANQYLNGNIAITQIYNRALSSSEITQNYNALKSRFNL